MAPQVRTPRPSYSQARESLLKAVPSKLICLLGCGGRDCRYEGPACWSGGQQAVSGVFSSWVTDDIVAMARPSTFLIQRFQMMEQFKRLNIRSIINMQCPGEHPYCGPALEPDSGFTYCPHAFMEQQIFFYNFAMSDFGVSSVERILDAVKVLAFCVGQGKVAVHCHAGLGRTGVLIACYLIYTSRISASDAVHYVRIKRPRSIQTRSQIDLVFDFSRLVGSYLVQFPGPNTSHGSSFSLSQYLQRQVLLLHGDEARALRHTPKVLYVICGLLVAMSKGTARPPELQAELEKRLSVVSLKRAVRETLCKWSGRLRTFSYWDDPLGFMTRKRNVLLSKRSYSQSDVSKVLTMELPDVTYGDFCQSRDQKMKRSVSHRPNHHLMRTRLKHSSNPELHRNNVTAEEDSVSKAVAASLAQQRPLADAVLRRVELLQEELNVSECGWASLIKETDPCVLATLLWTWLDKLKEPVLSDSDTDRLIWSTYAQTALDSLHPAQRHTIVCLLDCVRHVVSRCPQYEQEVLQRLVQTLTRHCFEESQKSSMLLQILRSIMKELNLKP